MKKGMNALMIAVIILGAILIVAGMTFKIMHWPLATSVLISGLSFQALGVAIYFLAVRNKS